MSLTISNNSKLMKQKIILTLTKFIQDLGIPIYQNRIEAVLCIKWLFIVIK